MRTPGFEAELAVGFLRTEGLLEGQEVLGTTGGDVGDAEPAGRHDHRSAVAPVRRLKGGGAAFRRDGVVRDLRQGLDRRGGPPRRADPARAARRPEPSSSPCPDLLRAAQRAFDETGGLHAAALFTPSGELIAIHEDVGRHNALDKLVGSQVLAGAMPLHERL